MFNKVIRCRKLEKITEGRKKNEKLAKKKKQNRVIFQITFANKSTKPHQKNDNCRVTSTRKKQYRNLP
jgi:hypothetical protein